jgi:aromatic-L-amino-acid/L-tryptophan decarboxylase
MKNREMPAPVSDLDWSPEQAREFGLRIVDLWEQFLRELPSLPVARRQSQEGVAKAVAIDIPEEPMPLDRLTEYLREVAMEYSIYPGHPGFVAYISGAGTVPGAAAELLASAINQNVGGWLLSPAATEIELAVARRFAAMFGLPEATSGGIFTSGGAMANFVGLKAARDSRAGWNVAHEGVQGHPSLVLYVSEEGHVTIDRAADMLGLGRNAVRHIPTDDSYKMSTGALKKALSDDLQAGHHPFAAVGTAGTTSSGVIDPLREIGAICRDNGMWFHVDAAYGGAALMVSELRPMFAGIEDADSITFDPHKWLYTPQSGSSLLVRDVQHLADSFLVHASYIHQDKERSGAGIDLGELGPQFSRGFYGLKVWASLLAHGTKAYARRIGHDVELARYLHDRVVDAPDFEPLAPVTLSITCFRYVPEDLPDGREREDYLNELNERINTETQLDGRVFPSNCVMGEKFGLRSCIVNFRTEAHHLDLLLDVAREIGVKLDREMRPVELN